MTPFLSLIWHAMRSAAIERHRFLKDCPTKWAVHMQIVRKFYGY